MEYGKARPERQCAPRAPAVMSTAVSGVKPRAPKPWDKLRRHVRSGSLGAVSQPSSPGSPEVDPGPFHLRDGNLQERNIANAGGPVPSARHSEPAKGAPLAELAAQAAPAQAGAASPPPSRVYARSKSAPGSSSAPSDDKAEKTRTRVSPGEKSSRSKSTALGQENSTSSAPTRPTRDASSSGADTQPEVSGSVEFPSVGEGPDAFQWLLTRQLEVEMSLRGAPPATQADVEATRATFASFCVFFDNLRDGAAALSARAEASGSGVKSTSPGSKDSRVRGFLVPPEDTRLVPACEPFSLFQELLHRVAGFTAGGSSVDEQRRDGDVPMHQAKVLYRASVATDAVLREVDAVLGQERVRELAATVRKMRAMLRVKMEDANDVRMAEEAVRGARRFFDTLKVYAEKEGKEDVEVLRTLREA